MQSRGDVTYDASCNRATWSVDGRDFEDSERFLIGWACWIDSWPKPRNLPWSHMDGQENVRHMQGMGGEETAAVKC